MPSNEYRVQTGDTLAAIARRCQVSMDVLARANGISDVNRIYVGQVLKIPEAPTPQQQSSTQPPTYRVRAGELLEDIAVRFQVSSQELCEANGITDPSSITVGQVLIIPKKAPPPEKKPTPQQPAKPAGTQGGTPSTNEIMAVAFRITGAFEGGKANSYQNQDSGIVSYGKHQATLASGTLGTILQKYVDQSKSPVAKQMAAYMGKVNKKDESLRHDAGFKKLLLAAADDPVMGPIQDGVFAENFWGAAEQGAKHDEVESPLALAMYYDTNIQGGLNAVRKSTAASLKGKEFTEAEWLTEFNTQRDLRLKKLVTARRKAAKESTSAQEKKSLERDANWIDGSRVRVTDLQKLVTAGDLQLHGDKNGKLLINQKQVDGLGATASSNSSPNTQSPAKTAPVKVAKTPPAGGTSKAGQGVDLKAIARNVHDAMAGLGTDELKVYDNLAKLNHDATLIKQFKSIYLGLYQTDVVEDIKGDFSNTLLDGDELDRALSFLHAKEQHESKEAKPQTQAAKTDTKSTKPQPQPSSKGTPEKSGRQWVSRFLPSNNLADLKEPFQANVRKFFDALHAAGVKTVVNTTLRPPQRSYLMYYAREIKEGRLKPDKVPAFVPQHGDAPVNIDWAHLDSNGKADLKAAKDAAEEMDGAYGAAGAIGKPYHSNHNGGEAIDVDFRPKWGIGKSVLDANGNSVAIKSKKDAITVGATYSVFHWNYSGPKAKKDDPHWSKTGN